MNVKRGDVLLVDLEPVKGSEQGRIRPCLVIQNDVGNASSSVTIVAAISSRTEKEYSFTSLVSAGEGGLSVDSLVLLNQLRTISVADRVLRKMGSLKPATMQRMDAALRASLGLD